MNTYEALMIFDEALKDAALDEAVGRVKAEVVKLSGTVEGITRLGRRPFARELRKKKAGQYVLMTLRLDGAQVKPLLARLKLAGEVFRVQVIRVEGRGTAVPVGQEEKGESNDGVV